MPYYIATCGLSVSTTVYHFTSQMSRFSKKKIIKHKMCVLIFSTTFVCKVTHSKNVRARYYRKCEVSIIIDRLSKNNQISNFMKIRPVGAEFFSWGCTERQTGKTKLTVAFSNFPKAPKTQLKITIDA